MITRLFRLARNIAALLVALSLSGTANADDALILGSYAYPGLDREQALAPLADLIEKTTGRTVAINLYRDPDAIAAAVAAGEVDVAVLNLGAWLKAASAPFVRPLALPDVPAASQDRYRAVLLARPQVSATELSALRIAAPGLRFAMVLPGSTSGGIVQLAALAEQGKGRLDWRATEYAGSHEMALAALLADRADIAAIAEATWRTWLAANTRDDLVPKEIWRSAPLPSGPVVCRQSARMDCEALGARLLSDEPAAGQSAAALATGWPELAGTQRFTPYEPARYATLIAAARIDAYAPNESAAARQ